VNLQSMLAARMPPIQEPDVRSRLELVRCIRNFAESSDASRQRIVRTLSSYGLMAYTYIEASYTNSTDLQDKIELIQAVTGPHRPYSAQIFSSVHEAAIAEITRTANQPPDFPEEYVSKRPTTLTREQRLRNIAHDTRLIEGYASASGGPFNAIFLLKVYKRRYDGDSDALLKNLASDRARLAAIAADCKESNSACTPEDRVLLIETAFPWMYKDNDELKSLAEAFLKKLLPESHPKWDAPQSDWFRWWSKHRNQVLKGK